MRKRTGGAASVVTLALALGLVHCAAPVARERPSPEPVAADEAEASATAESPTTASEPTERRSEEASFIAREPGVEILATIDDGRGGAYVTGTFRGSVSIGLVPLKSAGMDDVFVARYDATNRMQWIRVVGSPSNEGGPRVTLEGDQVTLVGVTTGDVDCGSGKLPMWSSEMFFLCVFDGAGETLRGGTFPTGKP